jgi:catechol 2,3-dioxygenase-like lactoylglutathione lyase family enzyme
MAKKRATPTQRGKRRTATKARASGRQRARAKRARHARKGLVASPERSSGSASGPAPRQRRRPRAASRRRAESRKNWRIESIFHFTVNCTNFERSLAFYQAIGFKLLRDNRDVIWPDYVAGNFGMTKAQGRGALLAIDDGPTHTRLDLIQWLEPAYDPAPDKPWSERVPRIVALRTRNVHAAYEELRAKGIEFITPPRSMDPNSGIVGVMLCRDPDGLLVEFIEYEPGLLGSRISHLAKRS